MMAMIAYQGFDTADGNLSISAHDAKDSEFLLSYRPIGGAVNVELHLSRKEAGAAIKALEEVVAAYDAKANQHNGTCDEPVAAEVR